MIENVESKNHLRAHTVHLIDVTLATDGSMYFVYDLSYFYRHTFGRDKEKYDKRIEYIIAGKMHTVNIICWKEQLSYEKARQIAILFIENSLDVYRLD